MKQSSRVASRRWWMTSSQRIWYMATLDDILSVLRRDAVAEQTQKDVLAIAYSLQGDILHG